MAALVKETVEAAAAAAVAPRRGSAARLREPGPHYNSPLVSPKQGTKNVTQQQ